MVAGMVAKRKKHPGGRPRKVSDVAIAGALARAGGSVGHAARQLGVTRQALHARILQNEELRDVIAEAKAMALDTAERTILRASKTSWRAAAVYLRAHGAARGWGSVPVAPADPLRELHAVPTETLLRQAAALRVIAESMGIVIEGEVAPSLVPADGVDDG